jgi:hypothetical protein
MCGPAMLPSQTAETESGEVFMVATEDRSDG